MSGEMKRENASSEKEIGDTGNCWPKPERSYKVSASSQYQPIDQVSAGQSFCSRDDESSQFVSPLGQDEDKGREKKCLELCHVQLKRSIQACTQMLYDVFDYNIGMIEELEKHEEHGKLVNSGILSHAIPVDYKKRKQEVTAGIELQLICLKAEMESLPLEVTSQAKKDLVMQTLKWAASREAAAIPYGDVDHYCKNVLEILLFGTPKELPNVDHRHVTKVNFTNEQVNEALQQVARQRHLGDKQDEEFHKDQRKEATFRAKRQTEAIREGALRLIADDGFHLAEALEKEGYVHDLLMVLG